MTPHIATIRIKMPQNGTRERLLSSRNLSTKDLSASAPVVNEVVLGSSLNKGKKKRKGRGPLVHSGYFGAAKRGKQLSLAGGQSVDLHLEVFVLTVLSDHRLNQFSYCHYRLALPDAHSGRVVGSGRVDGQGEVSLARFFIEDS